MAAGDRDDHEVRDRDRARRDSSGYAVSVSYDYVADGRRYTGTRVGFSRRQYARKKRAQAEAEKYPLNSSVAVYFDPEKPTDAVLTREYPDSMVMIVGGAGLMGLAAVLFVWSGG